LEPTLKSTNHSCFAIFLAGTFAALFIFSTVAVLLLYFPTKQLLNPDFYKQSLVNHQIYHRLPEYVAQSLATGTMQDQCSQDPDLPNCLNQEDSTKENSPTERPPIYFLILNQQEWEAVLNDLIDPTWLQTQTESVIDQVFQILFNSSDPLNTPIDISLVDIKSHLAGEEGTQAFLNILDAQPDCSFDQVLGLLQLGLGLPSTIDSILCRPPDYVISELTPIIQSFLINAVNLIPDQIHINLFDNFFEASSIESYPSLGTTSVPEQIQTLRTTRKAISMSPMVPLLFIFLVTLIVVRSLRDFLLWWGISFLSAGLITLVLAISVLPLRNLVFIRIFPYDRNAFLSLSAFLINLGFEDIIREMTSELIMSIVIPAGLISLIGFLLLLGLVFLKNNRSDRSGSNQIDTLGPSEKNHSDL
jgi:hypothetical protein